MGRSGPRFLGLAIAPVCLVIPLGSKVSSKAYSGTTQQAIRVGGWSNPSRMGSRELKFKDTYNGAQALTFASATFSLAPGATQLLNGLVPGSAADQRIGRKITMKSLYFRYAVTMNPTSTGGSPVRILIVYDKQANATAPAVTDILTSDLFIALNNLSNRDRFVTLCDIMTEPIATGNNYSVAGQVYKKISFETMYNAGTAGTIGDITSGSVYVMAAHNGAIGTANASITWYSRIRYED